MGVMGDLTRIAREVEWARRDIHRLREDVQDGAEGLRESIGEVAEAVAVDAEELTSLGTLVELTAESVLQQATAIDELRTAVQGQGEAIKQVERSQMELAVGLGLLSATMAGNLAKAVAEIMGEMAELSWLFYSPGELSVTITGADDMNILFKVVCEKPADSAKVAKRVFNLTVGDVASSLSIESTPDTVVWDGLKAPRNAPVVASLVDFNKIGEPSDAVEVSAVLSVELPERPGALSLAITGAVDDGPDYAPPAPVGKKK